HVPAVPDRGDQSVPGLAARQHVLGPGQLSGLAPSRSGRRPPEQRIQDASVLRREFMKILFATDGSESAEGAAQLLRLLPLPAGSAGRALTVTHARWETPQGLQAALHEWGRRTSEAAAAGLEREGVEAFAATRAGAEAQEILEEAESWGADLIVLGSE